MYFLRVLGFSCLFLPLFQMQGLAEEDGSGLEAAEIKAKVEGDAPVPADAPADESVKVSEAPAKLESWDLPTELDPKVKIKKIYDFLNDSDKTPTGGEQSLDYEFKYFNHGAVTKAQKEGRKGHYYVVTWSSDNEPGALSLRFDYRQKNTREKVTTIEIPYQNAKGTLKGTFSVTGDSYRDNGDVLSWRVSVVRDGKIVAQSKSFVW